MLSFTMSASCLIFYMVGNHGKLMFRPHMKEDWIIWGLALIFAMPCFIFAINLYKKDKDLQ